VAIFVFALPEQFTPHRTLWPLKMIHILLSRMRVFSAAGLNAHPFSERLMEYKIESKPMQKWDQRLC
jgi:hypothetical protein